ncbi:hypothetical protein FBU59_001744 [Linderina macrospora]|uniref:Uncharacterized protein n=1 Tax=Linderina macrospora TaxID=4868 RepID=A0ACC1JCX5_9FUNG|nr:hypothetical protein FBU59_001744 [Linderina macrospora]
MLRDVVEDMQCYPDNYKTVSRSTYLRHAHEMPPPSSTRTHKKTTQSGPSGTTGSRMTTRQSARGAQGSASDLSKASGKRKSKGGGEPSKKKPNQAASDEDIAQVVARFGKASAAQLLPSFPRQRICSDGTLVGKDWSGSVSSRPPTKERMARVKQQWEVIRDNWGHLDGHIELGREIGHGRSGYVVEGRLNGQRVAFKLCSAHLPIKILREIDQEVANYGRLSNLQGSTIPRLLAHGFRVIGRHLYLVLALECLEDAIGDDSMSKRREKDIQALPQGTKDAIIRCLAQMHEAGIVHGDARAYNVLLVKDPVAKQLVPKLIDFAFSFESIEPEDFARDIHRWSRTLGMEKND